MLSVPLPLYALCSIFLPVSTDVNQIANAVLYSVILVMYAPFMVIVAYMIWDFRFRIWDFGVKGNGRVHQVDHLP